MLWMTQGLCPSCCLDDPQDEHSLGLAQVEVGWPWKCVPQVGGGEGRVRRRRDRVWSPSPNPAMSRGSANTHLSFEGLRFSVSGGWVPRTGWDFLLSLKNK